MSKERSLSPDPPPFPLPQTLDRFVQSLKDSLIRVGRWDSLNQAVQQALNAQIKQMTDWGITSADAFLEFASGLMSWTPSEDVGGKEIYSVLCLFYFVFDQPAINDLQTTIDISSIQQPMKPLSRWVVEFAIEMGAFMNTKASLTPDSYQTFVNSPLFNLDEAELPDPDGATGGFLTFNQLFGRKLKPGMRPVSCPDDDRVIVYPADSTFDGRWTIQADGTIPINTYQIQTLDFKNIPWPISDLVEGSDYAKNYDNGTWMHSFLGPTDYHRQHAPVSGTVVEAKVIPGLCYLNVEAGTDSKGNKILKPHRRWSKKTTDDSGKRFDAPDDAGYQFLQARGCITINNPTLGYVTVLPVGMCQVSSVCLCVKEGDKVVKGVTEISYFQFGGSDCVVIFESRANVCVFGAVDPETHHGQKYLVGEVLGYANLSS